MSLERCVKVLLRLHSQLSNASFGNRDAVSAVASDAFSHICGSDHLAQVVALVKESGRVVEFLDVVQAWLDWCPTHALYHRVLHLLTRLARKTEQLPCSLFIRAMNLDCEREPFDTSGGFSDIFRGVYLDKGVVLKRLRINVSADRDSKVRRALCREALVWRQLRHRYILPFIGIDTETFSQDRFLPCLVAHYMERGTLRQYVQSPIYQPSKDLLRLLLEAAEGIEYLHSQHIIHGDIKDANILIDDGCHVQLCDFGLTSIAGNAGMQTTIISGRGTPSWVSPERLFEDDHQLATPEDVYAYACLCYYLFAQHAPFHDLRDTAIGFKVYKGERPPRPPSYTSTGRLLSDETWMLIEACWSQAAYDRPDISTARTRLEASTAYPPTGGGTLAAAFYSSQPFVVDQWMHVQRRTSTVAVNSRAPVSPPGASEGASEAMWKRVTDVIPAELVDDLVCCFLATSYYLFPFLHIPTFVQDYYSNARKWSDGGFVTFVVAICCISSLHIDNPDVRASGVGMRWFHLFRQLRALLGTDRSTLYTIQAMLIGAVYAVGQDMLSHALTLVAEAVTLSIDAGLHRSTDACNQFDVIEKQIRLRTFWCIYVWDKQASAEFGRPPMLRLRDCDVAFPAAVDDVYITPTALGAQPPDVPSRMAAFVALCELAVVLEAVLDTPPSRAPSTAHGDFLARATGTIAGTKRNSALRDEEALLEDAVRRIPPHWAHSAETAASLDVVRTTQAEHLHSFELYVRLLIHRHRFTVAAAERLKTHAQGDGPDTKTQAEIDAIHDVHACASRIVQVHLHIATRGLLTFYGINVVHQLTQAGRAMVDIYLETRTAEGEVSTGQSGKVTGLGLDALLPSLVEGLRSTFSLLRNFSGLYACSASATDMMEEICYLSGIPLDMAEHPSLK